MKRSIYRWGTMIFDLSKKSPVTAGEFSTLRDELISPTHTSYISHLAPVLLLLCGRFALSPPCRVGKGVTDLKYTDG